MAFIAPVNPKDSWNDGLFVINHDGSGLRLLDQHVTGPLAWSPDGTMVAYSHASGHEEGLYVAEVESAKLHRLTSASGWDGEPFWSPDGTKIAFVHDHYTLRVADLAMGMWRTISRVSGRVGSHAWSPDSRYVYFRGEDASTKRQFFDVVTSKWHLYRVEMETGEHTRLWEDDGLAVIPSPDGTRLAVILDRNAKRRLFLADARRLELREVAVPGFSPQNPHWSPAGDSLIVEGLREGEISGLAGAGLLLIGLKDGPVTILAKEGIAWNSLCWSSDGTKLLFGRSGKIMILDLQTRGETIVRDGHDARWSP